MTKLSILDLAQVPEGATPADALHNARDLAQHAERWGYERFWLAEHHNMVGIASAATSVVIGHVAGGTKTIRVGAGGIMLPNHSPLVIAEQFGTLEALHPGRIDLGLGRAPGSDQTTARAMRRNLAADADEFPQDVVELINYFEPARAGQALRAVPGAGLRVPVWILGSSLFGAQLAAHLGLPYAFASHFAPDALMQAIQIYRTRFTPSQFLDKPYVMAGFSAFAADTDDQARLIATSQQQAIVRLRTGRPGTLPPPDATYLQRIGPHERAIIDHVQHCSAIGAHATVRAGIAAFIERTGVDELIITSQIFDHQARRHSYEMIAAIRDELATQAAALPA